MYSLCASAWLAAVRRKLALKPEPSIEGAADAEDVKVYVTQEDLEDAATQLRPSLSAQEAQRYEYLRHQFEGSRKGSAPVR
jgi:hypothetical protein